MFKNCNKLKLDSILKMFEHTKCIYKQKRNNNIYLKNKEIEL